MAATVELTTKPSQPEAVDDFLNKLRHPLKEVCVALRRIILEADKSVGEEIFWKAPCFFFTGKMKPFKPKEYRRYIVGFNLYQKDCIRLIFLTGARVNDTSGLLVGDYEDGRRLALFSSMEEVKAKKKSLQKIIKTWLRLLATS